MALVGRALKSQLAASPACDSSSARDVGSMPLKSISSARLSRACDAMRAAGAAASSSSSLVQVGTEKPSDGRKRAACSAARVLGGVPVADASSSGAEGTLGDASSCLRGDACSWGRNPAAQRDLHCVWLSENSRIAEHRHAGQPS